MKEKCITGGMVDATKALEIAKRWQDEKAKKRKLAQVNNKKLHSFDQLKTKNNKIYLLR